MNGNTGIVPTMPMNDGFGSNGGEWIFGLLVLLGIMNGGFGNNFGSNGMVSNIATADQVANQGLQNNLFDMNNYNSLNFGRVSDNITNASGRINDNLCDVRQAVFNTGAGLSNQVLENRYTNQLAECQTQRDILMQTNQLGNQASVNALEAQASIDKNACDIKSTILADGEKTRALITNNLIDDLRSQLVDAKNKNSDLISVASTINAIRPYPVPSYQVSSPYTGLYGTYFGNNGFYGNNF